MIDHTKIQPTHLRRTAFVYIRQSSAAQVEYNRESTARQYALVERVLALGWRRDQVSVIDEDPGLSGASTAKRTGFARMTAEVALGHAGIVLGLEVSRLARNNADWYRNKAARGELRRGLPVGLVWGEEDGEVRLHPDEAVTSTIRTVFQRFAELGSARRVWLWFRSEGLSFPLQSNHLSEIRWVAPTYTAIHHVLTNPVYAGAYTYGKTRRERYVDAEGVVKNRTRHLPRSQWSVLIPEHHAGFIDWATYEANQARLGTNTRPTPHQGGGAVREGTALLQGLATCGHCGRRLRIHYRGRNVTPGYHCAGKHIVNGRGTYCLNVGGVQIDEAVTNAFLEALQPAGIQAALLAAQEIEADHDAALAQWRLAVERARYETERAERRYRTVEPENRLVARGLEAEWERHLRELEKAQSELARREQQRPRTVTPLERSALLALGNDLEAVWFAPTTTPRDQKELLRTLLEEVIIAVYREEYRAHLTLRWRGGMLTEIDVNLPRSRPATIRTDEDTVALVRRLAVHYPDAVIAGILNKQDRATARGLRFNTNHVGNLRRHWNIPRFEPTTGALAGELLSIKQAAAILGIAPSTIHRWVNDGFIAAEQLTPGAPWRIRLDDELRGRFVEEAPAGYLTMQEATKTLGVSRQTVLQRVKRGEIEAVHLYCGRRKGLRIRVIDSQPDLFTHLS